MVSASSNSWQFRSTRLFPPSQEPPTSGKPSRHRPVPGRFPWLPRYLGRICTMSDSTFTISGTAQVGQVLSASPGFTYQWYRSGVAIAGATSSTYTLVAADSGNTITATRIDSSEATSAVAAGSVPVNTALPTIAGTAQVGQTLTATNGTWTNSPTSFTYQWNRAGTAIGGATASTYVPVSADVGNTLTVSVVAANSGGSSSPAISSATSAVIGIIPKNSAVPTISGTAQASRTLNAT